MPTAMGSIGEVLILSFQVNCEKLVIRQTSVGVMLNRGLIESRINIDVPIMVYLMRNGNFIMAIILEVNK